MGKKQVLLDSVRKLLAIEGVTEKDIVKNLKSVGLDEEDAKALVREAKGAPLADEKITEKPSEGFGAGEDASEREVKEHKRGVMQKAIQKKKTLQVPEPQLSPASDVHYSNVDFSKLWETGLLTTIDAKLEEMHSLKNDIDSVVQLKVVAAVAKESKKIQTLYESQQKLFISKVDTALEEKADEVKEMLGLRLAQLKALDESITKSTSKLEAQKTISKQLVESMGQRMEELEMAKNKLASSLNAEMIENQSKIDDFLKKSQKKLNDLDLRVSKTLQFESKIAEGLVKDAENKVGEIVAVKVQRLGSKLDAKAAAIDARIKVSEKRVDDKITELNTIQERVDPEVVQEKLAEMVEDTKKEAIMRIGEMVKKKTESLEEEVEEKIGELNSLQRKVDPRLLEKDLNGLEKKLHKNSEELKRKMGDFSLFKEQFLAIVSKNTEKFNRAIKEFNNAKQTMLAQSDERIKMIDAKIAELGRFERSFANEMGIALERLAPEAKKGKKPKK